MRISYKFLLPLMIAVALGSAFGAQTPTSQKTQDSKGDTTIDESSATSLQLKILHNREETGTATGFVVEKSHRHYLVTNRHVVLACALDQSPVNVGGWICANKVAIYHNRLNHLGEWFWVEEDLFDARNTKRWFEHPTLGAAADLVALPLEHEDNVQFYPLDMELRKTDIVVGPADSVSIVGFPFGLAQERGLPVWKTGTVASDLDIDFQGKPMFLVDTTSRPGMSGSPVYAVRSGAYRASNGSLEMATKGSTKRFLGVYSEENQAAELGVVWKAQAVMALYDSLP
jgi:Trypsin-like peptidase domain